MQTFLFYDVETSGLSKSFDQILQFAAIRTDTSLKELERYSLTIQLNQDITPSPYAVITHHIGMTTMQHGISEYEAILAIHQWMNTPGTISLGYNTLGFDDEFLRFSFFRHLLPPYTHQYANQCSRMDLYPMTVMYALFKPDVLTWPEHQGKKTLKLEALSKTNQLAEGRAHDAMVDVLATVALAKCFYNASEMWQHLTGYFNKTLDIERMLPLQKTMGLYIDGKIGTEKNYVAPVVGLGQHRHYKNQSIWLRLDTEPFANLSDNLPTETMRVMHKKPGEPGFILPSKDRFLSQLTKERLALAETNYAWLENHPKEKAALVDYYTNYQYPNYPTTDADASLYVHGFWGAAEQQFCQTFHRVTAKEKVRMTEHCQHPLLKTLATRLLGRHFPESLTPELAETFQTYLQKTKAEDQNDVLIDYQGKKRLTPKAALEQINEIKMTVPLDNEQQRLLDEMQHYLASSTP